MLGDVRHGRRWVAPLGLSRLTHEERLYVAALLSGALLLAWAVLAALQAQGRFPALPFRLPNLEDLSLPGRPVLLPLLDPGPLRTAMSEPATTGQIRVNMENDVIAEIQLPDGGMDRPVMLVARGNLPRVVAPQPPVAGFTAIRFVEIFLVDARTGDEVEVRDMDVEVRVAVRAQDLRVVGGDPARLLFWHWDDRVNAWEDSRVRWEDGWIVGRVRSLSPFAVGMEAGQPARGDGLLAAPATPTSAPVGITLLPPDPAPVSTPTPVASVTAVPTLPSTPRRSGSAASTSLPLADLEAGSETASGDDTPAAPPTPRPVSPPPPPRGAAAATGSTLAPGTPLPAVPWRVASPPASPTALPPPSPSPTAPATSGPSATPTAIPEAAASPTPVPVVSIGLPGSSGALFNVAAMQPGQTVSADVIIQNNGVVDFLYTLTVDATTSSSLDQAGANGLQLRVERCGASFTICTSTLVYEGPAVAAARPMGGPQPVGSAGTSMGLRPNNQDYLRLRFTLPLTAMDTLQGQQSILRFTWTATQAL